MLISGASLGHMVRRGGQGAAVASRAVGRASRPRPSPPSAAASACASASTPWTPPDPRRAAAAQGPRRRSWTAPTPSRTSSTRRGDCRPSPALGPAGDDESCRDRDAPAASRRGASPPAAAAAPEADGGRGAEIGRGLHAAAAARRGARRLAYRLPPRHHPAPLERPGDPAGRADRAHQPHARGDAGPLRHRRHRGRHGQRPAGDALRAPARPRHQGRPHHGAARRPRLRAGRARGAAHHRPDPGQAGRRRRGPQPRGRRWSPWATSRASSPPRRAADGLAGPRPGRQAGLHRPGADAAPADRRLHRHRQERLPERHPGLDPAAVDARRAADDPDRPQEGRAEPLREHPAPAHAGRHEHEGRGRGALQHRPRDGEPLRADGHGAGAQPARLERGPRRRPAIRRCPRSWSSSTSWPT